MIGKHRDERRTGGTVERRKENHRIIDKDTDERTMRGKDRDERIIRKRERERERERERVRDKRKMRGKERGEQRRLVDTAMQDQSQGKLFEEQHQGASVRTFDDKPTKRWANQDT